MPRLFVVLVVALALGGCASGSSRKTGQTLRVLALNVHFCEGKGAGACLEEVANLVKSSRADVVALRGVARTVPAAKNIDMMTTLSDLTGMTYTFARTGAFSDGETGIGLLTRFPILEETRRRFAREMTGTEHGGYLKAILEFRGAELAVTNAELGDSSSDERFVTSAAQTILATRSRSVQAEILCVGVANHTSDAALRNLRHDLTEAEAGAQAEHDSSAMQEVPISETEHIFFTLSPDSTRSRGAGMTFIRSSAQYLRLSPARSRPLLVEFEAVQY